MEAADVVADVEQPDGRAFRRGELGLESQHLPRVRGVPGEVHGRAAVGPRPGRIDAAVLLMRRAHPGESVPAQATRVAGAGVLGVDPGVGGDTRVGHEAVVTAPVQPPFPYALLLER